MIGAFLHKIVRKIVKETGAFQLLWCVKPLRPILWKSLAQPGEFYFHKSDGREFRMSDQFDAQNSEFFHKFGFGKDDFENRNILDIGAGSRLRAIYFNKSNIYVIEPLADKYQQLPQSDFNKAKRVYSTPAETFIDELFEKMDFVMCINVLDHCFDPDKVITNAYKYLKKGGEFLLSVDLHEDHKDPMHPVSLSEAGLDAVIEEIGFSVLKKDASEGEFTHDKTLTFKLRK